MTEPTLPQEGDRRRSGTLILLAALAVVLVLAFSLWNVATSYRTALADTQANADNLARAFANHVSRSVSETRRIVDSITRDIANQDGNTDAPESILHQLLVDWSADAPQLQGLVIINETGTLVAGSLNLPEQRVDVSDREYFTWHRDNADRSLRVGDVTRSRVTQEWFISATSRIVDSEGRFRGVVVAALAPEYFADFHASVVLPGASFVELVNQDGEVLARSPMDDRELGVPSELVAGHRTGAMSAPESLDQGTFLVAEHAINKLPMAIKVAIDRDASIMHWRNLARNHGIFTIVGVAILLLLLRALRQRTRRLESSEADFRRLAEERDLVLSSIPDAVIVTDASGMTVSYNPAAKDVFGASVDSVPSEERSRHFGLFLPDGSGYYPSAELPLARAIRGESVDDVEILIRNESVPEGLRFLISARPIMRSDGGIEGGLLVCRNVTALRDAEQRLIQAQKMDVIGQLTGGIAHDFNNLLTVIVGNSEVIAERANDQTTRELALMTNRAAQRGAELTHRLLAFARRQPLIPEPVDVRKLLVDMEGLLRRVVKEDIDIRLVLADDLGIAFIDQAQLESALLNLTVNARDAMSNGGRLTIEASNVVLDESYAERDSEVVPGSYVLIAVSDTGIGISAADMDRVFDPFFTTKPVGKGTGLGLSMVYGFIKQSRGHIGIYSESGSGTTVRLYLPRADIVAVEKPNWEAPPDPLLASAVILVVEDDELVREHVEMQLSHLGYQVISASDGIKALDVLRRDIPIDLLFTDVIMPGGMDGRELANRAGELRPGLRVLFTSGYTENSIVHHGRLDAGVELLQKPYRRADLERKIRDALTRTQE
jgi:signal transduction histidine kinase